MTAEPGKWLILMGGILIAGGIILYFFSDKLGWLGQLPGDIRIEKENFRFYFPLSTMILISIILSILISLIVRFFRS